MSRVRIRQANPARDAQAILDIYAPYILKTPITFEKEIPSIEAFTHRVADIAQAYPYLLMEVDGQTVGYAYAHREAERAAFDWNAELSIYLHEDWLHRGLGVPLYALLIRLLRHMGVQNLYALIVGSNAGSIRMHEAMGFRAIGTHERTGYKFGVWHDLVWLHRRISEATPGAIVPFDALDAALVAREIERARREAEAALAGGTIVKIP